MIYYKQLRPAKTIMHQKGQGGGFISSFVAAVRTGRVHASL